MRYQIYVPIYDYQIDLYVFPHAEKLSRKLRKITGSDFTQELKADGCFISNDKTDRCYMVLNKTDIRTTSHECVHAATFILHNCGIPISLDNDETMAYLIGYLTTEVEKKLKCYARSK